MNIGKLQTAVDAGRLDPKETVTAQALVDAGIVRRSHDGVRLLGDGELKAKLKIEVAYASKSALEAVEKAGGSVTMIEAEKAKVREATPMKGRKPPMKKAKLLKARIDARAAAMVKANEAPAKKAPAAKAAKPAKEKSAKEKPAKKARPGAQK